VIAGPIRGPGSKKRYCSPLWRSSTPRFSRVNPLIRDGFVRDALLVQQVLDHLAGCAPCWEDRERFTTECVRCACDIDPAAARIVARSLTTQFVRRHNAVSRGRNIERWVHRKGNDLSHGIHLMHGEGDPQTFCFGARPSP
jgi:hypothetical protein